MRKTYVWVPIFWIPQFHKGCKPLAVKFLACLRNHWLRGVPPTVSSGLAQGRSPIFINFRHAQ